MVGTLHHLLRLLASFGFGLERRSRSNEAVCARRICRVLLRADVTTFSHVAPPLPYNSSHRRDSLRLFNCIRSSVFDMGGVFARVVVFTIDAFLWRRKEKWPLLPEIDGCILAALSLHIAPFEGGTKTMW